MVVAFGATGNSMVLSDAVGSTAAAPIVTLTAAELQFLNGNGSGVQTIGLAVEEQTPTVSQATVSKSSLVRLYTRQRTRSRTTYASKKRIAVVVPGIFSEDASIPTGLNLNQSYMAPILSFLTGTFPTDGNIGTASAPFDPDEVWAYNYDYTQPMETNGRALATAINNQIDNNGGSWGDKTKFEIHFIGHSMGGLVTRWALEKVGMPSACQLITLGTPHAGVPLSVLKYLGWVGFDGNIWVSLRAPGIRELVDDSTLIASLQSSTPAAGVQYDMVAGSSHTGMKGPLGDVVNLLYQVIKPSAFNKNDGIVPEYSALGGPGAAGSPQPFNHMQLVTSIGAYWSNVANSWLFGMNRKVQSMQISPQNPMVAVGGTQPLTVDALDKDGDKLDPTLIHVAFTNSIPVTWSVDNTSIATIDVYTGMLTGVKQGTVNVTATTVSTVPTTTGKPVTQTVSVTIGAEMVWVPGGTFLMGNPSGVLEADESPRHTVMLDGYWIDRDDVTVAQFRAFDAAAAYGFDWTGRQPFYGWRDNDPMTMVSWYDAKAYATWANCLLPTEAQWEKAARGTDGRNYPWGGVGTAGDPYNGWDPAKCDGWPNSFDANDNWTGPHPVGSFPAGNSPYGVRDMAGNVQQWCADWYSYYASSPSTNPTGPAMGTYRVLRGGHVEDDCLCVFREHNVPDYRGTNDPYNGEFIGFRCVSLAPGP